MKAIQVLLLAVTAACVVRGDRFYAAAPPSSEAPRPVYVASPSTENPGPLYLAAMVNQLSTERFKIEGPTPVPPQKSTSNYRPQQQQQQSSSSSNQNAPLQGVLEALYQQATQNHMQRPPDAYIANQQPDAYSYPNQESSTEVSDEGGYFWDMPESDANEVGVESDGLQKGMEKGEEAAMANPLFAAMASFIGLSTLFAASVLFMPKLGGGRAFDDHHEWARNVLNALDWDK